MAIIKPENKLCPQCKLAQAHWPINGLCVDCGTCQYCGHTEWLDKEFKLCESCMCRDCHLTRRGRLVAESDTITDVYGRILMICNECYIKYHPELGCTTCKKQRANVIVFGDKPTLCLNCLKKDTPCSWCHMPSLGLCRSEGKRMHSSCFVCSNVRCCFQNGCRPPSPCTKCRGDIYMGGQVEPDDGFYFRQATKFYPAAALSLRKVNRSPRLISPEIEAAGFRWAEVKHLDNLRGSDYEKFGRCICLGCFGERKKEVRSLVQSIGGSIVRDESLPRGGFEINMPPSGGDIFLSHVKRVSDLLVSSLAYTQDACGTHLHIDARDLTDSDLRRFLVLYSILEVPLITTQPAKRILAARSHCFPCGKKYAVPELINLTPPENPRDFSKKMRHSLADAIYKKQYGRPPRLLRGDHRQIPSRYDGVNVHSRYYRGTIEIRYHAGTLDAFKIQNWGMIWATLVDKAVEMTDRQVASLDKSNPKELLLGLVPKSTHTYLQNRWNAFEHEYKGRKF